MDTKPRPGEPFVLPERFSEPTPAAPDEATWRAMTPEQREAKVWELIDALPLTEVMSKGTAHSDAKMAVVSSLRRFFGSRPRGLFVAPELMVAYPDEPTFVPDVLAVCDVELKHRNSWMVVDGGADRTSCWRSATRGVAPRTTDATWTASRGMGFASTSSSRWSARSWRASD